MSFFSFSREAAAFDMTPVENDFLMNYMPSAPEKALRVYLYARMLCLHPEIGELADMAKALRMDRDEVLDAFQYWEQRGLVEKLSDQPPRFELRSLRDGRITQNPIDLDVYKYGDLHAALDEIFGKNVLEKRHYVKAGDWLDLWGLSQDAALEIVKYEKRLPGGQTPDSVFKRADRRVKEWVERGVRTLEEVKQTIAFEDQAYKLAATALEKLAIRRGVMESELNCARRWVSEWNLTMEDVVKACEETKKARNPSIGYLDAILKTMKEENDRFKPVQKVLKELGAAFTLPTPYQEETYEKYIKEQEFDPKTILLAATQNAKRNRHRFQDLEWMLDSWAELGLKKYDQAKAYVDEMEQKSAEMGALMKLAGVTRVPNRVDLEYYENWKQKYNPKLYTCAAELSRAAWDPPKQMGELLAGWSRMGIADVDAARAAAPEILKDAARAGRIEKPRQQNYIQREYRDEDFGKDFFYDLDRDHPEEGDEQ